MPKRGAGPWQTDMFLIFRGVETVMAPTPEAPAALVDAPRPKKGKKRRSFIEATREPSDEELLAAHPVARALEEAGLKPWSWAYGDIDDADCTSESRLLKFPASVQWHEGVPHLFLSAPVAREFPFVKRLESITGLTAEEHIYESCRKDGLWHHAIDLADNQHIDELLATRHLTTDEVIAASAGHHVYWGSLSLSNGRRILEVLGSKEPADQSKATLLKCLEVHNSNGVTNFAAEDGYAYAWSVIHAIEHGVVTRPTKTTHPRLNPVGIKAFLGIKSRAPEPAASKQKAKPKALKEVA